MGITGAYCAELIGVEAIVILHFQPCQKRISVVTTAKNRDWVFVIFPIQIILHDLKVGPLVVGRKQGCVSDVPFCCVISARGSLRIRFSA